MTLPRRGRDWVDRLQPTLLRNTARKHGLEVAVQRDFTLLVTDAEGSYVAVARFSPRGQLRTANGFATQRPAVLFPPLDGYASVYTARNRLDNLLAWLDAERPATWKWLIRDFFTGELQ